MTVELRLCLVICAALLLLLSFENQKQPVLCIRFLILARAKLCLGASCHFPGDCLFLFCCTWDTVTFKFRFLGGYCPATD